MKFISVILSFAISLDCIQGQHNGRLFGFSPFSPYGSHVSPFPIPFKSFTNPLLKASRGENPFDSGPSFDSGSSFDPGSSYGETETGRNRNPFSPFGVSSPREGSSYSETGTNRIPISVSSPREGRRDEVNETAGDGDGGEAVKPNQEEPKTGVDLSDGSRDIRQMIESRGFGVEEHRVTTEDGFNLTLFRIMNPKTDSPGRPVILQHGLLGSGVDWLVNQIGGHVDEILPDGVVGSNLGFELAKRGFDVWLSNSRGNTYSPIPDVKEMWNFSFDQHIKYDTPAIIEYVLQVTGRKSVGWVGHSQGTLVMFGLLASQPRFNSLVKPFIALAPVSTVSHIRSPIRYLAKTPFLLSFIRSRGGRFMPSNQIMKLLGAACPQGLQPLCTNLIFVLVGYNQEQLNEDRLPVYLSHTPAGTSAWNIVHFGQNYLSGKFRRFDLGNEKKNIDLYGQSSPPEYDLTKITNKYIALFSSLNDWLAPPEDVLTLKHTLKVPLLEDHVVPNPKWNHLDFIWGKDAGQVVYKRVIELLDEFADTAAGDSSGPSYNSVLGA